MAGARRIRKSKAPGKRRGGKRGGKRFRRARDVPDMASLSVKRTLQQNNQNFTVNNLFSLMNTQLVDFPRAVQVAQAYQHYRIRKITVTFKPTFDTFVNSGATTQSKMNLYWMIDKSGSVPTNINLEGLKAMGAKPLALDEKPIKISWRPSVLESAMYAPGAVGQAQTAKYSISPYLATSNAPVQPGVFVPSGIDHLGLYWYVEQLLTPGVTPYEVEVEVQFQFKKPLANITSSTEAIPAHVAVLNDSKDGILGGADGV